ncbi:DNA-binding transcriptional activator FeaR [Dorea longicatena]|nr:DNA-binding transcriptional activator FeaR [Dorea longicatena]
MLKRNKKLTRLSTITAYIKDHYTEELSLSEIALNNGFPNSKALSKVFRKKYGVLPSEYRRAGFREDS